MLISIIIINALKLYQIYKIFEDKHILNRNEIMR